LVLPLLNKTLDGQLSEDTEPRLAKGMAGLKERAKNILALSESAEIYARVRPLALDEKALSLVEGEGRDHLQALARQLTDHKDWQDEELQNLVRAYAEQADVKMGKAAQPLRAALTGRAVSPSIFEVMEILGRDETLGRIEDIHNRG
ncbi:MAG: glutamate--tRNA ligase, partial [Alphaproteobacteria bacterium]|nr:glutamate--tRNA ligase [Alphaproteobacteria bacterium]